LGITFISYFLQILSEMNEVTEFFKYFTVYTLADLRNVLINNSINFEIIIISFLLTTLFILSAYIKYNKKELV